MTKNKTLNEKQTALINALKTTTDGLTLAEASAIAGVEIRPGSVNPLVGRSAAPRRLSSPLSAPSTSTVSRTAPLLKLPTLPLTRSKKF